MKKKKYSPKISIIMVVFNEEKTLIKSIQSILSQNFKKYELLIYDNNSSDKTKYFLRKISNNNEKIKVFFSKKNLGLTEGLNFLLKKTKSDVIARLDGDDFWNANKLRLQFNFFKNSKRNFVGTNSYYFKNNKVLSSSNLPLTNREIRKKIIYTNPFIHSSIMFNKRYFSEYDTKYIKCQDYDAWLKLSKNKNLEFKNISRRLTYHNLSNRLHFLTIINDLKIRFRHLKNLNFINFISSTLYILYSIIILLIKFLINKK